MSTPVRDGFWALTEREKQTLRLIVRGHDAKSTARSLGLSVHTINERLRDARRKMAVSSSREAARMLLEAECGVGGISNPESFVDAKIGGDATSASGDQAAASLNGAGLAYRHARIFIGVFLMTLVLGLLALAAMPQAASSPPTLPATSRAAPDPEVVNAGRQWLALLDQARWEESYQATGTSFRGLNTVQGWAAASDKARAPLGAMMSRTLVSQENLPAPPYGYEVLKFRTRFANKAEAVETVTLDREEGTWRVVGVMIG